MTKPLRLILSTLIAVLCVHNTIAQGIPYHPTGPDLPPTSSTILPGTMLLSGFYYDTVPQTVTLTTDTVSDILFYEVQFFVNGQPQGSSRPSITVGTGNSIRRGDSIWACYSKYYPGMDPRFTPLEKGRTKTYYFNNTPPGRLSTLDGMSLKSSFEYGQPCSVALIPQNVPAIIAPFKFFVNGIQINKDTNVQSVTVTARQGDVMYATFDYHLNVPFMGGYLPRKTFRTPYYTFNKLAGITAGSISTTPSISGDTVSIVFSFPNSLATYNMVWPLTTFYRNGQIIPSKDPKAIILKTPIKWGDSLQVSFVYNSQTYVTPVYYYEPERRATLTGNFKYGVVDTFTFVPEAACYSCLVSFTINGRTKPPGQGQNSYTRFSNNGDVISATAYGTDAQGRKVSYATPSYTISESAAAPPDTLVVALTAQMNSGSYNLVWVDLSRRNSGSQVTGTIYLNGQQLIYGRAICNPGDTISATVPGLGSATLVVTPDMLTNDMGTYPSYPIDNTFSLSCAGCRDYLMPAGVASELDLGPQFSTNSAIMLSNNRAIVDVRPGTKAYSPVMAVGDSIYFSYTVVKDQKRVHMRSPTYYAVLPSPAVTISGSTEDSSDYKLTLVADSNTVIGAPRCAVDWYLNNRKIVSVSGKYRSNKGKTYMVKPFRMAKSIPSTMAKAGYIDGSSLHISTDLLGVDDSIFAVIRYFTTGYSPYSSTLSGVPVQLQTPAWSKGGTRSSTPPVAALGTMLGNSTVTAKVLPDKKLALFLYDGPAMTDSFAALKTQTLNNGASLEPSVSLLMNTKVALGTDLPVQVINPAGHREMWTFRYRRGGVSSFTDANFSISYDQSSNLLSLTATNTLQPIYIVVSDASRTIWDIETPNMSNLSALPLDMTHLPAGQYKVCLNGGLWYDSDADQGPCLPFTKTK